MVSSRRSSADTVTGVVVIVGLTSRKQEQHKQPEVSEWNHVHFWFIGLSSCISLSSSLHSPLTTKKISQHPTRPHASPEAAACAGRSVSSWVLLSMCVVTVETVTRVGTRIA